MPPDAVVAAGPSFDMVDGLDMDHIIAAAVARDGLRSVASVTVWYYTAALYTESPS